MICKLPEASLYFEANVVDSAPPVLYIHAALGSSEEMKPIRALFPDRSSALIDLPGHGKTTEIIDTTTMASVASIVDQLLDRLNIPQVDIVGYSLGGYVGLQLAAMCPDKVRSVVTHAMKFYWTPQEIEAAISTFSTAPVPERTIAMISSLIRDFSNTQLTAADIRNSKTPALITTGERDEFVTAREVSKLWQEIGGENVSFAIFPGAGHSLRKLPLDVFAQAVREFWGSVG